MSHIRILSDFFLAVSIFVFPFWVPIVAGIFFVFKFRNFYEYIVVMFCFDLLYSGGTLRVWGIPFMLTIASLVAYFGIEKLKERLILDNQ